MFSAFQKFGRLGASASAAPFSPSKLFAAGEVGGVWDFTTLANLYQDSAGTTPCTAVGQTIGLVLDTSGRGNHASQATSTKRPLLGRMPAGGVRNLLTYTETIPSAHWEHGTHIGTQDTFSSGTDPSSGSAAIKITEYTNTGVHILFTPFSYVRGVTTISIYFKAAGRSAVSISLRGSPFSECIYDLSAGASKTLNGATNNSITDVGGGWWKCVFSTSSITATSLGIAIKLVSNYTASTVSYTGDGISGVWMWRPQLELGSTATPYQKVGAAYDITESGVASVYTAYFDGVDDCLVSPSIDFTVTDAMSVFAGFRKTSDAARGMVAELSATTGSNNGSFALTAPNAASATIVYESKGTALTDTSATIAAPADSVIAAVSDISADSNVLRRNGAEAESDTGDQGTGNFGNYAVYVGQRGESSLPYKGFMTALSTRGAATDADTIVKMEQWLAARTPGVTLP